MAKKKANNKKILLPEELTDEAKKFISAIIDDLKEKDRLEKADTASLYILAKALNTYIEANQILKEEGLIFISDRQNKSIHPAFKIARDSEKTILMILESYGGTLRARQKLKELDAQVEESPLSEFIKQSMED